MKGRIMVRLVPMNNTEYQAFLAFAVRDYADDKIAAGNWQAAEALEKSSQEFAKLLPNGVATPDHYLFNIEDDVLAQKVGIIWLARAAWSIKPLMFIYDLRIEEPYRRKGYGERAMRAAEEFTKSLGFDTLALHVFGFNHAARALYEKLGYEITNINMAKKLT
jgi:RimJ/RimL family protein N-acetyltransferase